MAGVMPRKGQKQIKKNPRTRPGARAKRPSGKPVGRPEGTGFQPSGQQHRQVETYAGLGLPQDQIARLIINPATGEPISETTLKVHFHHELQAGIAKANAHVVGNLYKHTAEKPGAAIFWVRARLGWRDRTYPGEMGRPATIPDALEPLQAARRVAFMLAAGGQAAGKAKAKA